MRKSLIALLTILIIIIVVIILNFFKDKSGENDRIAMIFNKTLGRNPSNHTSTFMQTINKTMGKPNTDLSMILGRNFGIKNYMISMFDIKNTREYLIVKELINTEQLNLFDLETALYYSEERNKKMKKYINEVLSEYSVKPTASIYKSTNIKINDAKIEFADLSTDTIEKYMFEIPDFKDQL